MEKFSRYLCIGCILFLVIALLCQFYGADRAIEKLSGSNSVDGQITHSTELVEQAGAANKSVQQAIERAEKRAGNAQAGIDECETILTELRTDNQRAKQIVDDIIREAQSRAKEN